MSARRSTAVAATAPATATDSPGTALGGLAALAVVIGEEWAHACATALRAEDRPVNGGWPGTMSEARARMLTQVASRRGSITEVRAHLDELSRMAYLAARSRWQSVAEPDLEP